MNPTTPPSQSRLSRAVASVARASLASPARRVLLATLLLTAIYSPSCAGHARAPREPPPGVPHITVMTYNVNYGLGGDAEGIGAIEAADADLVLLQETTVEWEQALRDTLGDRYPHMTFRHCCLAGGLAVLSKLPLAEREYVHSKAGWFPAWRLIVHGPAGPLQVLNLHLRPQVSDSGSVIEGYFTTPAVRRAEAEQYYPLLEPGVPTLVVGDLNESPGGDAIAYLEAKGFRNALPEFAGEQDTWRWQTSIGTIRSQLDHLLYRGQLEPLDVRVVAAGRSDHLPVVGTFQLGPTSGETEPPAGSGASTGATPPPSGAGRSAPPTLGACWAPRASLAPGAAARRHGEDRAGATAGAAAEGETLEHATSPMAHPPSVFGGAALQAATRPAPKRPLRCHLSSPNGA